MIWILNSSQSVRRILAIAIMVFVAGSLFLLLWLGVSDLYQKNDLVIEQRILLGQLQKTINRLPLLEEQQATILASRSDGDFLEGSSKTVIRAELQQRFKQIAGAQKVNVISVGDAPEFIKSEVIYIGLQANVSGTIESLHRAFLALESAQPLLFITRLTVRSTGGLSQQASISEPVLIAQLRLYGALRPNAAANAEPLQ
tara:strand:+ start:332 stop:931 length:600 start_codon:yes stop_codon:yes gene_type:complete